MSTTHSRPNVVLLTCHDLGQHVGCYGIDAVETPHLDALADTGVRFENAVATSPVCSPSRGSLVTGRYPQSNGLLGLTHAPWWWSLDEGEVTIAELLGSAGYETHLAGLDHVSGSETSHDIGFQHVYSEEKRAPETVAAAGEIFSEAPEPFFAQFGFSETHRSFDREPATDDGVHVPAYLEPTAEMRADLARFQAEIAYLDERVGEVLDLLSTNGVREETIVVFAADHGIPYPGAKWWCRDPGVEIALMMDGPGSAFDAAAPVESVISNVDVLPTILDAVDVAIPDRVEGRSYLGYLSGEAESAPREAAFTQYTSEGSEARGIVTADYTLIRNVGAGREIEYPVDAAPTSRGPSPGAGSAVRPFAQLYDRRADPGNLDDVAEEHPDRIETLSGRVRAWMAEVDDPLLRGGIRYPYAKRATRDLLGARE